MARGSAVGWKIGDARTSDGYRRGSAALTIFHQVTDERVVVHGDGCTFVGTKVELEKVQAQMRECCDVKVRGKCTRISARHRDPAPNVQVYG